MAGTAHLDGHGREDEEEDENMFSDNRGLVSASVVSAFIDVDLHTVDFLTWSTMHASCTQHV